MQLQTAVLVYLGLIRWCMYYTNKWLWANCICMYSTVLVGYLITLFSINKGSSIMIALLIFYAKHKSTLPEIYSMDPYMLGMCNFM